jgi:hypothetical protein
MRDRRTRSRRVSRNIKTLGWFPRIGTRNYNYDRTAGIFVRVEAISLEALRRARGRDAATAPAR